MSKTDNSAGFAPAKVNLTLHVIGQRDDGYHLLDSLVTFADIGDYLTIEPACDLSLSVIGPMAEGVPTDTSNLVMKAAQILHGQGGHITLDKHLPAAAGIGGGSSDAAAALRILSDFWHCAIPENTALLGADVPVCLNPVVQRMSGIGDVLTSGPVMPMIPAVLVNPKVHVPTPAIFKALKIKNNSPMPELPHQFDAISDVVEFLVECRNDLTVPATQLAPIIADVLEKITQTNAAFVQMSGSGATCFGLYDTQAEAAAAAEMLRNTTDWWVVETLLGDQTKRATT